MRQLVPSNVKFQSPARGESSLYPVDRTSQTCHFHLAWRLTDVSRGATIEMEFDDEYPDFTDVDRCEIRRHATAARSGSLSADFDVGTTVPL